MNSDAPKVMGFFKYKYISMIYDIEMISIYKYSMNPMGALVSKYAKFAMLLE